MHYQEKTIIQQALDVKKYLLYCKEDGEKCRGKTNSLKEISPIIQMSRFLKIMRRQGYCLNFRVHVNSDLKIVNSLH
jgi:hypothetical protein